MSLRVIVLLAIAVGVLFSGGVVLGRQFEYANFTAKGRKEAVIVGVILFLMGMICLLFWS